MVGLFSVVLRVALGRFIDSGGGQSGVVTGYQTLLGDGDVGGSAISGGGVGGVPLEGVYRDMGGDGVLRSGTD
jgi:hypothetical protein